MRCTYAGSQASVVIISMKTYCEILTHALELIDRIRIVVLILPFGFKKLKGLLEHM